MAEPKAMQEPEERERVVEGMTSTDTAAVRRIWVGAGVASATMLALALWFSSSGEETGAAESKKERVPRPVQLVMAERGMMPLVAEYRGELDTEIAELAAQGAGRLLSVAVNLGDTFKAGDILAKVDAVETQRLLGEASAQSESAAAAKARATAQLDAAREEAERAEKLLAENLISAQDLNAKRSAVRVFEAEVSASEAQRSAALARMALYREQLAQAELRAPFQGAVGRRYLDSGATVQPGTSVLRLVKGGPLEVRFRASEIHLARLTPGTRLTLTTLGTGERKFEGKLVRVSAEVNRSDRSVEVEGALEGEYPELRPGMYATVEVSLGTLDDATIVPTAALVSKVQDDGSSERGLYVVQGDKAQYVRVDVLGEHEQKAGVVGIEGGAKVVIHGQDLLSDGAPVREVDGKAP